MRPVNVLYIGSDQHRFDCLGVNGHPLLQTPNIDALAARGANYVNAYTPCPVCTPARASLMTGQWSFQHASLTIPQWTEAHRSFLGELPTLPGLLHDVGYYQGYVGKWHLDDRSGKPLPQDLGFDEFHPEGDYFRRRRELGISMGAYEGGWGTEVFSPESFDRYIRGTTDPDITPEQSRLHWGADTAIEMLRRAAATDRPFFVRWDPSEPHLINVVPEPYASLYDPRDVEPWGSFGDSLEGKPLIQRQQRATWGVDDWRWDDWAPVVARYLGEIALLDAEVGRVVTALEEIGAADNTVVVYTTDHGDMCGSHGMIDKGYVMYDDVVRVPLVVYVPEGVAADRGIAPPRGTIDDGFVSHVLDLASTIVELAGVEVPETFQGQSLLSRSPARPDILSAYHGQQFGLYSQRMVRDRRWKYVWNPTAEDELYDLEVDPWERTNRAADPSAQTELDRLRLRLIDWMEQTKDPLLHTWTRFQLVHGRKLNL